MRESNLWSGRRVRLKRRFVGEDGVAAVEAGEEVVLERRDVFRMKLNADDGREVVVGVEFQRDAFEPLPLPGFVDTLPWIARDGGFEVQIGPVLLRTRYVDGRRLVQPQVLIAEVRTPDYGTGKPGHEEHDEVKPDAVDLALQTIDGQIAALDRAREKLMGAQRTRAKRS